MKKSCILLLILAAFLFVPYSEVLAGQYKSIAGYLDPDVSEPGKSLMDSEPEMSVCAGPINGTWKIESGGYELNVSGMTVAAGDVKLSSVNPSTFSAEIIQESGGKYYIALNGSSKTTGISHSWTPTYGADIFVPDDALFYGQDGLEKLSETEYWFIETASGRTITAYVTILDDSTVMLEVFAVGDIDGYETEYGIGYIFKRVGGKKGGGGGCNAAAGLLMLLPLIPLFVLRRKQ